MPYPRKTAMILSLSLFILVAATSGDADIPGTAKTADEIVAAAEKVKGAGDVNTAEFNHWGKHAFALWYCPFSGVGNCYLHIYFFDFAKNEWVRSENELIEAGGDLTVDLPQPCDTLIIRNSDGTVLRKVSLAKAPHRESPATTQQ